MPVPQTVAPRHCGVRKVRTPSCSRRASGGADKKVMSRRPKGIGIPKPMLRSVLRLIVGASISIVHRELTAIRSNARGANSDASVRKDRRSPIPSLTA